MLRSQFKDQADFNNYLAEQKTRLEKGFLTKSEREELKRMLEKDYKPIFIEEKPKISIIYDINELKKPCTEITKEDNVEEIVQKLKDTLSYYYGLGISANQIGINKKVSYIKIPIINKNKKVEIKEHVLINAKIIEKNKPIKVKKEGCLSFPGLFLDTKRFVFITVEYLNEKLELQTGMFQDLEGVAIQHECDHQNSLTILDRVWRNK